MVESQDNPKKGIPEVEPKTELEKVKEGIRAEFEEKFRNEQRINTKKEQELQHLREQLNKRNEDTDLSKALLGYLAQQQNRPVNELEDTVRTNQPDLIKQYEQITRISEDERKKQEYVRKADDIWARTQGLNLGENSEDAQEILDFLTEGKVQRAELRLKKLEAQKIPPKKEEPIKSIDEQVAEKLEEEKRKWMESSGQLTSDIGRPSSSSGKVLTVSQVEKMSHQEIIKEFGDYEGILKAMNEGRIR